MSILSTACIQGEVESCNTVAGQLLDPGPNVNSLPQGNLCLLILVLALYS
jgi:hypothetical protein